MKNVIDFPIRQRFAFPTATRVPMSVKQTYLWLRVLLNVGPTDQQRDLAVEALFDLVDHMDCSEAQELDLIAERMKADWVEEAEGHPNMVALWAVHYSNVLRRSLVKLPWRNTTRPDMTVSLNLNPVADELTWANE